ncbi:RNA polymerase subunit sigma-24 [Salinisphaera orenii MK-B5]|uniref:RNA polymerase subunit sigma-24 n=1 Tax=Salinisphaera orenii MK-B5 TaxID=856730 RepID=A0A423PRY8_9GAMM|nr:RNA polymerase sigma factor [Salinisphaera orenii]ROO28360.1 RNA polymerase subunit sigma-24 [Salinisphaera orenii MK-B5]
MIDPDMIDAEIPHLRRYARALVREREAADDLVQDTLERAWRKRVQWRPTGRLRSWLFRMLYRLYLDRRPQLQRAHRNLIALDDVRPPAAAGMDTDAALHCREVMAAIDALPEKQRAILLLVALEQPSYREGARALGLRVGTFRSRLSRAREQLNERLVSAAEPTPTREDANG